MLSRGPSTYLIAALFAIAALIGSASAHADVPAPGDFSAAIWSDKADYSPGEHVVLSGANWSAGESVHVTVNDDAGSTWNRSVDVVADDAGNITDEFDLPSWFVATYHVRAEGASGSTATYDFTDGNVKFDVAPTGATAQFVETVYSAATNCTGAIKNTKTVSSSNGDTAGVGSGESVRLDAAAASDQGGSFSAWSTTDSSPFTLITGTAGRSICVAGFQSGTQNYRATYNAPATNSPPTIARANATATVSEGGTAGNTGTWSDANAGDSVTLSASVGTVTKSGTNNSGTWSWSYATTDGPLQSQTVTITASDGTTSTSTTFALTVNNVAPAVTAPATQSASEGSSASLNLGSFTDPGADSPWAVDVDWGDGSTHTTFNATATGTIAAQSHTYADGPNAYTVSVKVTDKDNGTDIKTFTVNVANVAPTVTLNAANDLSVSEGSTTHTYSYTINDPGQDTVTGVSTSCGTNGTKVTASDTNTNTTGSFQCRFPDGPASSVVSASATDSDGATGNLATQSISIGNVAPTVNLTGATNVDEGSTHTYTFTVTDPGQDTFTIDSGFPDCDAGTSNNGTLVSGTLSTSSGGGSFDCTFPDGPSTANVKIKVTDSDNASDTTSQDVEVATVANVAPVVTPAATQSANEGASTSIDLGSFTDPGPDAPWSVDVDWGDGSAHTTFSQNTTGSLGSKSHAYADGPADRTVSVTVTDKNNGTDTKTFSVHVNNVAPTVTLSAANDLSVNEGQTRTYSYTIIDPGQDTVSAVTTSCGLNGTKVALSDNHNDASGSFQCFFPDGDATSIVSASATDSDLDTGNLATQSVAVHNVAPTVTLSAANDQTVNEGSTAHTYSYTIVDPGTDTITSVATSCGAAGTKVALSDTNTNTTGSFKCTFPDGPDSSNVTASATDSDGVTGNTASQSVTVNNVAPKVTLTGATTVDEGTTNSYTFTVTDPGQDTFTIDPGFPDCDAGATNNGTLVSGTLSVNAGGGSFDCTFPDGPSTANVKIKVTDSGGASDTTSQAVNVVTVANVAPTVTAAANQSANEGASTSIDLGSFTDPGPDATWTIDVDWGDGSPVTTFTKTATGSLGTKSHTYADGPDSHTVDVKVTDKDGGSDTKSFSVHVNNVAPTVTLAAGNDLSVNEGSTHTYSYSIADQGVDTVDHVTTDCGANGAKSNASNTNSGGSFDCTFPDGDATSIVSASATDSDLDTGNLATQTVSIANVAPTVTAAADQSADEGASTAIDLGSFSDPGAADHPWHVDVDWGDGSTHTTFDASTRGALGNQDHTYADGPDDHVVKVKVTDKDGASDTKSFGVHVKNVAPTVTLTTTNVLSVNEGSTHTYTYAIHDPGDDTVTSVDTSCGGNGTKSNASNSDTSGTFDCTFPDGDATSTISASATDSDGDTGNTATQDITIHNVAPTVSLIGAPSVNEGSTHTYSFTVSDPGDDTFTASAGYPDCDSVGANGELVAYTYIPTDHGGSFQCFFPDGPSSASVKMKVQDSDGASGTDSESVQVVAVANVAPTVTAAAGQTADEGASTAIDLGSFSDPGPDAPWHVDVDWGDGSTHTTFDTSTKGALGTQDHKYADGPDNHDVTVEVTDKDGASGTATFKVHVNNVAPTVTLDTDNDQSVDEGTTEHTYTFTINDPGDDTVDHVTTSCGDNGDKVSGSDTNDDVSGSFKCTFPDGDATSVVSASATDSDGDTGNLDTQSVEIANVAPTVTLDAANDLSVDEGSTHTYKYTISDPGQDTVDHVTATCGADGTKSNDSNTNAGGSFDCTFADGPDTQTVSINATDSDGDTGNTDEQDVTVNNVAPTVKLTALNDVSVNEGSPHTYTFTISDPGQDDVDSVAVDCGTAGTQVGSATHTNASGSFQCKFPDGPDSSTVSASATDSDGDTGNTDTQGVTINNVAPKVVLTGAGNVDEGSTHTYSFTVTDPGDDTFAASAGYPDCDSLGANGELVTGSYVPTTHGGSFDCHFPDGPSSASVKMKVADSDGASGTDSESVQVVAVANVAPTVTAAADQGSDEGSDASFDLGSFDDPGASDAPWHVDVDWGDSSTHTEFDKTVTGALGSKSHKYADGPNDYVVTVTVTDKDGASDFKTFKVHVDNVAPTVTLDSDNTQSVDEGSTHTYSYSIADPGQDTVDHVTTSCGDNGTKTNDTNTNAGGSFDCTFPDGDATSVVSASATDSDNETGNLDTQSVDIANVAPTVKLSTLNDLSVNEGSTHTYTFSIDDPGADTIDSVAVSCGTAGTQVGTATHTNVEGSFQCKFPDGPDSSTVSASATDSDTATGNTDTQDVTVNNVAPKVVVTGAPNVTEGTTHTYSFTVTDPGNDTFTASTNYPDCDFGGADGTLVANSYVPTPSGGSFDCSFPDGPSTADVKMKVQDSDGDSGTDSESVQVVAVANVAPTVTAAAGQTVNEGATAVIDLGSFTDPGPDAPWHVDVDWGDGSTHTTFDTSTKGALGTKDHKYADGPGNNTVTVRVTDKNNDYDTKSFNVHVNNVAPTVKLATGNDQSVNEGPAAHTYSYTISDPGADSVEAVTTSCGANGVKGTESNTDAGGSFQCTFADGDASSTVSVSATDSDHETGNTDTQNVAIHNVAPTVVLGSNDLSVNEGSDHVYTFTISDPGADTITSVAVSCGGAGTQVGSATHSDTSGSFKCKFPDGPATSIVSASATDSDGATGNIDTQTVSVANLAPTVIVTGDDAADEGTIHTYNFSVTDAGQDTFTVATDYPDCDSNGSNGTLVSGSFYVNAGGGTFKCSFPDGPKSANVKVKVADSDGASDSDSTNVQVVANIANVKPTITAPANQSADEGTSTAINLGSFADPGANDANWTVDVDWGDGSSHDTFTKSATGSLDSKSHTYADGPATKTVTVKVTDKDGGYDTKTFQVTVNNVAPTSSLTNNGPIGEGGSATVSFGSATDVAADSAPGFHYEFHCDGSSFSPTADYSTAGTSSSKDCSYADGPATKTVRARIIDKDNGAREYTTNVVVNNVPPAVTAPADQSATEGSATSFDLGSFTDPGSDASWTVAINWGDGNTESFTKLATGSMGTKSHTYADNTGSPFTVTVKVTDKDGGYDSKTFKVTVGNVPPHITSFTGTDYLTGANAFITGGPPQSLLTTNFTDPGSDQWTALFTYPDGSPLTQTVGPQFNTGRQTSHTFSSVGCKTVSVKVSDDDGGSDTASATIRVGSGAFQPPMTNQPVTDKLKNGQTLPVKVHITDCAGAGATNLTPAIRLVTGDMTPSVDDTTTTITVPNSVSAADTTGYMRGQGNGDYIYNMAVNLPTLNKDYTVVIYPYATGSPVVLGSVQLGHVIQATK